MIDSEPSDENADSPREFPVGVSIPSTQWHEHDIDIDHFEELIR